MLEARAIPENESLEGVVVPVEDAEFQEIETSLNDKYFSKKPTHFILDPQAFISVQQSKSIEKILNNHAIDSTIDLYLCVFGEDQKIPSEGKHVDFLTRHFSEEKPVVMLYYYYGNPNRTEMVLSPSIEEFISSSEQQRALQSSLIRAMRANGSFEQLEEFLMQFSVRTYWMERMVEETFAENVKVVPVEEPAVVKREKRNLNFMELIPERFRESALFGAGAGVSVVVLWGLICWLRSRERLEFPQLEVETRLGGSHAAGIGAVVNFSSPAVSPARQREQTPEYLRRA